VLCPASNNYNDTITVNDTLFYNNDFALKCKTGFDLGVKSIEGFRFRPARNTSVHIQAGDIANFYGAHCANGISGTVTVTFSGPVGYVSPDTGALSPTNISGNILTYYVADFGSINITTAFNTIVRTDTIALNGSQVCFTVNVFLLIGDNNPANNVLTQC